MARQNKGIKKEDFDKRTFITGIMVGFLLGFIYAIILYGYL